MEVKKSVGQKFTWLVGRIKLKLQKPEKGDNKRSKYYIMDVIVKIDWTSVKIITQIEWGENVRIDWGRES